MSKYNPLWAYIHESGKTQLTLTFDEIGQIAGIPPDHFFEAQERTVQLWL